MMKQLLILLALCACFISLSHQRQYSPGRFIVKLETNDEATANGIAQELGMTNYGKLGELPNVYIFQRPTLKTKASRRLVRDVTAMQSLNSHNLVQWAEQDHVFEGVLKALPSDPGFANQWNYNNNDYPASAINVESVWNNSNTGQGIVVQVVDDGLWANNTDIAPNYLSEYSYNFATGANDPTPTSLSTYHGTFCGALIAGKENNGYCGVGVAYSAKLAGIRAIGVSNATTSGMANYLTKFPTQVHISSNSWGPEGCVAEGCDLYPLGNVILEALQAGVQTGRNNSGRIYVFAAGNEGDYGGNTNYQEHTTNRFVIPVGAIEKNGTRAYYSNVGASLLVVAPGGGLQGGVVSTAAATCSSNMGTSFATPQVSGVVALMLRENSQLGWRDVKSILLKTAYQVDANSTSWSTNAAGYKFSNEYGFGRVDAALAVATAKTWKNLGAELSLSGTSTTAVSIPDATLSGASSSITIAQTSSTSVTSVEHVQVVVKITHANRGQLAISLISPSGTESVLTDPRKDNNADYDSWQMLTVKSWGERANGTWTLKVVDSVAGTTGTLNAWAITVFGTGTSTSAAASIFAGFFIQAVVMVVLFAFML